MNMRSEGRVAVALDPQQLAVAWGDDGKALVTGGTGTGKTSTLIERAAVLLGRGVPGSQISLVGASDESAAQGRRLMERSLDIAEHLDGIFVGTVVQLANRVLRQGGADVLGISPDYRVWDRQACLDMLDLAWQVRGGRALLKGQLRRVLDWSRRNFSGWPDDRLPPLPAGFYQEVLDAYHEEMDWHHAVAVDELPALALSALNNNNAFRSAWISGQTRHLLLDDGELLLPREVALLDRLVGTGSLLLAVRPGHLGLRAHSPAPVSQLVLSRSGWRNHSLTVNHASTQCLFRLSSALRRGRGAYDRPYGATETCDGPEGEPALLVEAEGILEDIDRLVLDEIQRLARQGVPPDSIAVLYRRGSPVERMRTLLAHRGIPYTVLGGKPPDRPTDARCAWALLTLLLNPDDLNAARVVAAVAYPNAPRLLDEPASRTWFRAAREAGEHLMDATTTLMSSLGADAPEWDSLLAMETCWEVVTTMWDRDYPIADICTGAGNMVSIVAARRLPRVLEPDLQPFLDFCRDTPPLPGESKRVHLRRLLDRWSPALHPARRGQIERGVTFATFEAARGRFWDAVLIPDVSDQTIPGTAGPYSGVLDEELHLLCEATTRARRFLRLYYPADTGRAGAQYAVSRFLEPVRHLLEFRREPYRPPASGDPFADLM